VELHVLVRSKWYNGNSQLQLKVRRTIMGKVNGARGVSDNLHGDCMKAHASQNWKLNQIVGGAHQNLTGQGPAELTPDNTRYRKMPGRKKGMYNE
jgi:hypothetical protein